MAFTMGCVGLLEQCKQVESRSGLDSQLLPKQCQFYAILRKDVECRIGSNSNEFYLGFSLMHNPRPLALRTVPVGSTANFIPSSRRAQAAQDSPRMR
jgi:hypothetical protein